jgi:hypothetical protein
MKRILFFVAMTGLLLATTGCSTSGGLLGGGLNSGCNTCGNAGSGLFGGGLLQSDIFQDGPVRQWLRGDACDSCNVPSGQITYDSGFDSNCQSCGAASSPVMSAPATNYYPSYDQPVYEETSYDSSLPTLPSVGPLEGNSGVGSINESQFFGGASDNIELPPLMGN